MEEMSRRKDKAARLKEEPEIPNAFGALGALDGLGDLPAGPEESTPVKTSKRGQKNTSRGRVDIIRQTAHRGGKAVIVVKNFTGIGLPEKKELAKMMRKACGVGGTVKDGCIEIQGDNRDEVARILTEAGFNPVFAGG
jgi:translation initiation factor 1